MPALRILHLVLFFPIPFVAATFTVSNSNDSGAGSLRQAIIDLNNSSDSSNTISMNSSLSVILLSSALPAINKNVAVSAPVGLQTIDGNQNQIFFINPSISASFSNLSLENGRSQGGIGGTGSGGGGGGGGAGGAVFIADHATVILDNVSFDSCSAVGGNGGNAGSSSGGGGGGGNRASGGNGSGNNGGSGGTTGGGGGGGRGGNVLIDGGIGGSSGGGAASAGGNGGIGLVLLGGDGGDGGSGGAFGGGAGGGSGGNGLVLGGIGGDAGNGQTGGFSAGGGGGGGAGSGLLSNGTPGSGGGGGFGAGNGGAASGTSAGGGGGGAAFGGALFIDDGAAVTVVAPTNRSLFSNSSVTAGSGGFGIGGGAAGGNGSSLGGDLFLLSGADLSIDVLSGTLTLAQPIEGNQGSGGSVTKGGAGTLDFATNSLVNTYTAETRINDGILQLNSNANLGVATNNITLNTSLSASPTLLMTSDMTTARTITVSGIHTGTVRLSTGVSASCTGGVTNLNGIFNLDIGSTALGTFSGIMTGAGSLVKLGPGTAILSNASNSYSGGTFTQAGVLAVSADAHLGDVNAALNFDGGTLRADATFSSSRSIISQSTAQIDTNGHSLSLSGVISGSGTLLKTGSGTLVLSGSSGNTYTGLTTVGAGTLSLGKTAGMNAIGGNLTIVGGTVSLEAASQLPNSATVTLNGGTFNMNNNADTFDTFLFHAGTLSTGGASLDITSLSMRDVTIASAINLSGGGSVAFDNTNNGTATISGPLNLGSVATNFDIGNGAAPTDLLITGVLSNGGVSKTGLGTLNFGGTGANTYTGLTTVSAGTLMLAKTAGVNAVGGDVTIAGGTLSLEAANQLPSSATVTLNGGTFNMNSNADTFDTFLFHAGTLSTGGASLDITSLSMRDVTIASAINLSEGGNVAFDNTNNGTATISGPLNLGGVSTNFDIGNGAAPTDLLITGVLSNGGVSKTGLGTLSFGGTGANTYTGLTTVSAGTLMLAKTAGVNAVGGDVTIAGGTLSLEAANQLPSSATVTLNGGTFNMNSNADTFDTFLFHAGTLSTGGASLDITSLSMRDVTIASAINLSGGGSVAFDNTNNGTATISGPLNLGSVSTNFDIGNGTAPTDLLITGVLSNGGVSKTGLGTLSFGGTGANTYTGLTTVSAGTLMLSKTAGVNAVGGDVTITGGTLSLEAASQLPSSATVTLSGGTFNMNNNADAFDTFLFHAGTLSTGGASLDISSLSMRDVTIASAINLSGGGSVAFDNTNNGTAVLDGSIDLGGEIVTINTARGTNAVDMQMNGMIQNGGIAKMGPGILELAGMNLYAGGTSIHSGTLRIASDHNLGLPGGELSLGNGTLFLTGTISSNRDVHLTAEGTIDTNGNDLTFSGRLFGTGSLTKQNGGVLTLSGESDYSGGTILLEGTLQGTTASLQGNIENHGIVIVDQAFAGNLTANISGTGSFIKQNSGVVTLEGINSYLGGTNVTGGALQGNSESLKGNIANAATLGFVQSSNGTYLGTLSGTGTLRKSGIGTLNLQTNASQGQTIVELGRLNVNSTLTSSISIETPGTLGGTGPIVGSVINAGTLSPGNSIGTLSIIGDYVQVSGSTLQIEINPTQSSRVEVTGGQATLQSGSTVVFIPEPGTYQDGTVYTFFTAEGGINGTFSNVILPFTCANPAHVSIEYLANEIELILCVAPLSPFSGQGNAGAVAEDLDALMTTGSSDLMHVIGVLQQLTQEELELALNQLQPSLFKVGSYLQEQAAFLSSCAGQNRLELYYRGTCSHSPSRAAFFWIEPQLLQHSQNRFDLDPSWRAVTELLTFGCDRSYSNGCIGLAASVGTSQLQWTQRGHASLSHFLATLYGNWTRSHFYLDLLITGAYEVFHDKRHIQFSDVHRTACNRHSGYTLTPALELGCRLPLKQLQVRPYGKAQYFYAHEGSMEERGAESLNLQVESADAHITRYEAGINMSYCMLCKGRQIIPELHASYVWQEWLSGTCYRTRFVNTAPTFEVQAAIPQHSLFASGVGLTFQQQGMDVSIQYQFQKSSGYFDQSLSFLFGFAI